MSDAASEHFAIPSPEASASPPTPGMPAGKSVTLSITLHPNGQIEFQLPAGNKILSYGLLELARAQLDKTYLIGELQQQKQGNGGINGLLKRMGRS